MNRDETLALFAQGKEAWNAWAEKMLEEKARLEAAGEWALKRYFWGGVESVNDATRAWLDAVRADFSDSAHPYGFAEDVDFSGFLFPGDAEFDNATFGGDARFEKAKFRGVADFSAATFSGYAGFMEATFAGYTWFNRAIFSGHAGFMEATFSGYANFSEVTFSGYAGFSEATFSGYAGFEKATFAGSAQYFQSRFQNHLPSMALTSRGTHASSPCRARAIFRCAV